MRGVHFTLPSKKVTSDNKQYSHLYIGHTVVEDALYTAKAANKFIRIVLKSMGTYFKTKMSIGKSDISAKPRIINFITDLQLEDTQRKAIGELLIDIAERYKDFYLAIDTSRGAASREATSSGAASREAASSGAASRGAASRSARRGGMKIMKYNKIVEKNNAKIHNKDGKNTLVNDKELKINKIKDKIKILKQDKIKNKDKIIKQIKLIEDIKTKIKIEKERAKQKHQEKTSVSKLLKLPQQSLKLPRQSLKLPRQNLKLPRQNLKLPRQNLKLPQQNLKLPQQNPKLPQQSLKLPRQSLKLPQQNLKLPRQNLKLPRQNLKLPQQSLKLPQQSLKLLKDKLIKEYYDEHRIQLSPLSSTHLNFFLANSGSIVNC
jgi:hypothetical protein